MKRVSLVVASRYGTSDASIAMTAFLPTAAPPSGKVVFASPGGGYGRGYFDMRFPGHAGYSQAEHHTALGHILIAYDHLGVGESSLDNLNSIRIEDIAEANHGAVAAVQEKIASGTLDVDLPPLPDATFIGIGQSMGGGVSIIMQARHRSFAGVGVLGYSGIHTILPQKTAAETEQGMAQYLYNRDTPTEALSMERSSAGVADFVYPFHWEDVPQDIRDADMAGGYPLRKTAPPFGSVTIPLCVSAMMGKGYVREDAAAIDVPLFLGFGERDTSGDFHAEPTAYPNSGDITLLVVPKMAHMHNFASTRLLLWDRLAHWYQGF